MDYLIDVLKVVILLIVGVLVVSMLFEVWHEADEKDEEIRAKAPRKVLTLEETRHVLWVNYIYHFHGGC